MLKRHTPSFLLVILVMLLVTGSARAEGQVKIRIQGPPAVGLLPFIWMQEQNLLAHEATLEISISQDHQRGLSLLTGNELELLVTGANVGAKAFNRGLDLYLLNVNTWGIDYLLTAGFEAKNWKELEGKTLSLPLQGGPLDFLARYLLVKNGADPEKVEFVYLPSNNGARTFQLGRLDAIILPEPMVTITLQSFPAAVLSLDVQKEWGKLHGGEERIPFVGLFARGSFARENPELVNLINDYYQRGVQWVNQHPSEAAALAAQYFDQPSGVVRESLARIHFQVYPLEEARELVELFFREILDYFPEMIGGKLPDDHFYF